jgi:hypothetical protein
MAVKDKQITEPTPAARTKKKRRRVTAQGRVVLQPVIGVSKARAKAIREAVRKVSLEAPDELQDYEASPPPVVSVIGPKPTKKSTAKRTSRKSKVSVSKRI